MRSSAARSASTRSRPNAQRYSSSFSLSPSRSALTQLDHERTVLKPDHSHSPLTAPKRAIAWSLVASCPWGFQGPVRCRGAGTVVASAGWCARVVEAWRLQLSRDRRRRRPCTRDSIGRLGAGRKHTAMVRSHSPPWADVGQGVGQCEALHALNLPQAVVTPMQVRKYAYPPHSEPIARVVEGGGADSDEANGASAPQANRLRTRRRQDGASDLRAEPHFMVHPRPFSHRP